MIQLRSALCSVLLGAEHEEWRNKSDVGTFAFNLATSSFIREMSAALTTCEFAGGELSPSPLALLAVEASREGVCEADSSPVGFNVSFSCLRRCASETNALYFVCNSFNVPVEEACDEVEIVGHTMGRKVPPFLPVASFSQL